MATSNSKTPVRRLEPILDAFSRSGVSVSSGYRMIKAGAFPQVVKVGRMSYVLASEVDQWIDDRIAERDGSVNA